MADAPWSWARIISSYGFWALLGAAGLTSLCSGGLMTAIPLWLKREGLEAAQIGQAIAVSAWLGPVLAVVGVWVFAERSAKALALVFCALVAAGGLLLTLSEIGPVALALTAVMIRVARAGLPLLLAAQVAGACPGVRGFGVLWGVVILTLFWTDALGGAALGVIAFQVDEPTETAQWIIAPAVLAAVLISVADGRFFHGPPPPVALRPLRRRQPAVTFLLCFVPLYLYYWLWRTAAEVRSLSTHIDVPTGGGALALLVCVPLSIPLFCAELRRQIKAAPEAPPILAVRNVTVVAILGLLAPPLAAALLQSDINRLHAQTVRAAVDPS